jgi:hypothetical protein
MSDLARWKVLGAVKALKSEFATWDPDQQKWQPGQHFTATEFRPDGKISISDSHSPDGSVAHSRWFYNDQGQPTESHSWQNDEPSDRVVYVYDHVGRLLRNVHISHNGAETDLEICTYDTGGTKTRVRFLGPVDGPRSSTGEHCAHTA